jgi:hypothetical protein
MAIERLVAVFLVALAGCMASAGASRDEDDGSAATTGPGIGPVAPIHLEMPLSAPEVAPARASFRVGNYNIRWFGSPEDGPEDEELQLDNAVAVMRHANADLWILSEIVDEEHFDALLDRLSGFDGFLASDERVDHGRDYYESYEQKLAVVYRSDLVAVEAPRLVLLDHNYDFASRPPLFMQVALGARCGAGTFSLLGVHLKAYADEASYQRRLRAAEALHTFLEDELAGASLLVLGDWNDDIDDSSTEGMPTPFATLEADRDYRFFTRELSLAGVSSSIYGGRFIDHQLGGGPLLAGYIEGSTRRIEGDDLVADYAATTSDHFPIVSSFACPATAP